MVLEEKITALVPLRGGSQRVKDKNIRRIGGETLLERKIRTLKDCSGVSEIIVASDSEKYLEIAKKRNVETFLMEPQYASSNVLLNDAIHYLLSNMPEGHIMWSQVTSPLITPDTFDEKINLYFDKLKEGFDSLASCNLLREYLWDESGPVNYEKGRHPRSQDLKTYKKLNFAMMMIPRNLGIAKRYYIGDNPYLAELSQEESTDIDNEIDLFIANALLLRRSVKDLYQ